MPLRALLAAAIALPLALAAPALASDRPVTAGAGALVSFGPDFGAGSGRAWREGFATFEYRSDRRLWRGLRPIYGFAASGQGAVYGTVGLHGAFSLGPVEVTPHFSVGLFQDGRGGFDSRELLQFRSGIDAFLPVGRNAALGLGIYHVSNARITSRSANLDVVRLSLLWRL
jgi:hypothetical protein